MRIKLYCSPTGNLTASKKKKLWFIYEFLFYFSYDVIISSTPEELLKKFKTFDARVIFGAEDYCWPDFSLKDDYPPVGENEKRFLNSGGFIGYATDLYEIISSSTLKDDDDDQLFYTKIFLNKPTRVNV